MYLVNPYKFWSQIGYRCVAIDNETKSGRCFEVVQLVGRRSKCAKCAIRKVTVALVQRLWRNLLNKFLECVQETVEQFFFFAFVDWLN